MIAEVSQVIWALIFSLWVSLQGTRHVCRRLTHVPMNCLWNRQCRECNLSVFKRFLLIGVFLRYSLDILPL